MLRRELATPKLARIVAQQRPTLDWSRPRDRQIVSHARMVLARRLYQKRMANNG